MGKLIVKESDFPFKHPSCIACCLPLVSVLCNSSQTSNAQNWTNWTMQSKWKIHIVLCHFWSFSFTFELWHCHCSFCVVAFTFPTFVRPVSATRRLWWENQNRPEQGRVGRSLHSKMRGFLKGKTILLLSTGTAKINTKFKFLIVTWRHSKMSLWKRHFKLY